MIARTRDGVALLHQHGIGHCHRARCRRETWLYSLCSTGLRCDGSCKRSLVRMCGECIVKRARREHEPPRDVDERAA